MPLQLPNFTGDEAVSEAVLRLVGDNRLTAADPELALTVQQPAPMAALDQEARKKLGEKETFLREVWSRWQGQRISFESAVLGVPDVERFPILAKAGKFGGSALSAQNARKWLNDLGKVRGGEPDWSKLDRLADNWAKGHRQLDINPAFLQRFCKLFLSPGTRTMKGCWKVTRDEFVAHGMANLVAPWDRIPYYVRTRMSEQVQMKARCSKDYKNLLKGYIKRYKNFAPGDVWFSDHRTVDYWVRMPHPQNPNEWIAVRPYVTAVMDGFSGKLLAYTMYVDSAPNHRKILEALELAIRNAGNRPPRWWYSDQGKDFLKMGFAKMVKLMTKKGVLLHKDGVPWMHSVLQELGCEHREARGYNGKEKPIERLFRDQALDFDKMQVGYCGNNPATRPDYGETWQGDVMRLPALGQAAEELAAWVERHNATGESGKQSPDAIWAAADWSAKPQWSDARLFLALLMPQPTCPEVGRSAYGFGGVTFQGWQYSHRALREWDGGRGLMGQPVMVKTYWGMPEWTDIQGRKRPRAIFIFHPDGRLICYAPAEQAAAMIAETEAEFDQLGRLEEIRKMAEALDKAELEAHTGSGRVTQTLPALIRAPVVGDGTVAIGQGGLGTRRLPAAARPQNERVVHAGHVDQELKDDIQAVMLGQELPDRKAPDEDLSNEFRAGESPSSTAEMPADDVDAFKRELAEVAF